MDGVLYFSTGNAEFATALWMLPAALSGDANWDYQFDRIDIVLVQQFAKYLTGESATWAEGDWNGDGVFDQGDIVVALQADNYLQGPYAAGVGSLADPSEDAVDGLFAALPGE